MTSKDLKLFATIVCTVMLAPVISGCGHQADPPPAAPVALTTPQDQQQANIHAQEAQFEAQQRAKAAKGPGN